MNDRKDLFHKESINLANFKLKPYNTYNQQLEGYQPKFLFEFLNSSNDNSYVQIKEDSLQKNSKSIISKPPIIQKHVIDTNRVFNEFDSMPLEQNSSIYPELERLRRELEEERHNHNNNVMNLNRKIQSLTKHNQQLQRQLNNTGTNNKSWLEEKDRNSKTIATLNKKIETLSKQAEELHKNVREMSSSDKDREKHIKQINILNKKIEGMAKQNDELVNKLSRRQKELLELKSNIELLEQDFKKTISEFKNMAKLNHEYEEVNRQLDQKVRHLEETNFELESLVNKLQNSITEQHQKITELQIQAENINNLKKKISGLEQTIKNIKENREIAKGDEINKYDSKNSSKEVYQDIQHYLKDRCEEFVQDLKTQRMNRKVEQKIQNFLQQILHLNQLTISKHKKTKGMNYQNHSRQQTRQSHNLVTHERLRLEKSIEKLKTLEKAREQQREMLTRPHQRHSTINGNLSMLSFTPYARQTGVAISRSKSRKKIFE